MGKPKLTASIVNDRLFMAFPAGWLAGVIAGTAYGIYGWFDLQRELGRTLLVAVTASQIITLLLTTLIVRRIYRAKPQGADK